ncbi:MAG: GNAT family N-acetyltransferase [Candidatus Sulfotelmatobacter sp.]
MSLISAPLNIVLPVTLEGSAVRLEPLRREHARLFWEIAKNDLEDIFRWIPYSMKTPQDFERVIAKAFDEQESGESVVFATVERKSGLTIGSTRFMNIDRTNRRVEIGSTWIAPAWQRTAINTEAKCLMLRHAFEVWNCLRVELKRGCSEPEVTQRDFTHRRETRRHTASPPDHLERSSAGYGLFQRSRQRMARGESEAGSDACTVALSDDLEFKSSRGSEVNRRRVSAYCLRRIPLSLTHLNPTLFPSIWGNFALQIPAKARLDPSKFRRAWSRNKFSVKDKSNEQCQFRFQQQTVQSPVRLRTLRGHFCA